MDAPTWPSSTASTPSGAAGRIGELKFDADEVLPLAPSEYFHRNVWVGASFPSPVDADARHDIGLDHFMWGSDYPHHEACWPYTRESLRRSFAGTDPASSSRCSPATPPTSTASTSTRSRRSPPRFGPTLDEIAVPLDADPRRRHQPRVPPPVTSRFRRAAGAGHRRQPRIGAALAVELAAQGPTWPSPPARWSLRRCRAR